MASAFVITSFLFGGGLWRWGTWCMLRGMSTLDPDLDVDGQRLRRQMAAALEDARRSRRWSRAELAAMAKVSESTVIAAEGGRGGLNVYARLLAVVGLTVVVG